MKSTISFWLRVIAPAIALLGSIQMASSQADDRFHPMQQPIPQSYFSMNILFHPKNHVPWPSIPLGGWRTAHVNWDNLEPEKDRWNFDLLDKYAQWSADHHVEILMPLTYTPRWASSKPDAPTDVEQGNPPGLSGPPRDMADWRTFVSTVATRYKGRIHLWEIWNEPNRQKSWAGDVSTMVEMTKEAYEILKSVDPNCVVVSPSATEKGGLPFLDEFLSRGGGNFVDVIGYHLYVGNEPPENMVPLIAQVKAIMHKNGAGSKPLWDTEAGWLGPAPLPIDTASAYVARAYLLNWASRVDRFFWFAWEAHNLGINLTESDNATLAPAGLAYASIERWMTGAVMTSIRSDGDGNWFCELARDGKVSHVVWNSSRQSRFAIPEDWHAHSVTVLSGPRSVLHQNFVDIGPQPLLVE